MTHCNSCILAVDGGGTSLKAALIPDPASLEEKIDLLHQTFFSVEIRSEGTKKEILKAYETVGQRGSLLARKHGLSITRIAVCSPGPFDYLAGCSLMKHKYQAAYGIPLGPSLLKGAGSDCPVSFLHDSTAFLSGVRLSKAVDKDCFCGVIIGTGLGFAAMSEGRILENPTKGPAISIYARPYLDGISEDYVSKRGILRRYVLETQSLDGSGLTVAQIARQARSGDPAARKVFADTGFHLGQILTPVLKEHSFDTIVFGGAISKSSDLFLPRFSQVLPHIHTVSLTADRIDDAPLLGCAKAHAGHQPCG